MDAKRASGLSDPRFLISAPKIARRDGLKLKVMCVTFETSAAGAQRMDAVCGREWPFEGRDSTTIA